MAYKVNVSAIKEFMRCRYRWWAKYVMNWVPREEAQALKFGNFIHEIFEGAANDSMEDTIEMTKTIWRHKAMHAHDPFERDMRIKVVEAFTDLEEAFEQWADQLEFEEKFIEVEQPFEMPHPDDPHVIIQGKPDRVVRMDGKLWHVQNRGLAAGTNFGVYIELAKRHYHEHVYMEALRKKYPDDEYGGTIFNLVRKLKYRTHITKANPLGKTKKLSEIFWQHPMVVSNNDLHKHVMKCVLGYAHEMEENEIMWKIDGTIPKPNEDMNGGLYGNSPDLYFRVLIGELELGDPRYFKKREDMYKANEEAICE